MAKFNRKMTLPDDSTTSDGSKTYTAGSDGGAGGMGFGVPEDIDKGDEEGDDTDTAKLDIGNGDVHDNALLAPHPPGGTQAEDEPDWEAVAGLPLEDSLEGDHQSDEIPEGAIIKVPGAASTGFGQGVSTGPLHERGPAYVPNDAVLMQSLNKAAIVKKVEAYAKSFLYHLDMVDANGVKTGEAVAIEGDLRPRRKTAVKDRIKAVTKSIEDVRALRSKLEELDMEGYDETGVKDCMKYTSDVLAAKVFNQTNLRAVQMAQYALASSLHLSEQGLLDDARRAVSKAFGYVDAVVSYAN